MAYSFDFGAQVTRICMNEIRRRGLDERKILRKSAPNSILLLKVFRQQNCTADDLIPVSIHSVATLMQDTLWCCQERIVPKKVWRIINYETCTLPNLSKVLTKKGEALLIEILDFLVELMQHKANNLMDAYHLGEAMGKVTLGPADCDPIIAEKAGHFMTRMIIEHSKWMTQTKRPISADRHHFSHHRFSAPMILSSNISSNSSSSASLSSSSSSSSASSSSSSSTSLLLTPCSLSNQEEYLQPMSKTEAARAKAKSYNRLIQRIKNFNVDWIDYANVGLRAMLDDDYELEPVPKDEPWISIFAPQLDPKDANASPLLYRIMSQATKEEPPVPSDPFASSYWFQHRHSHPLLHTNQNGGPAFSEFAPLIQPVVNNHQHHHQHQHQGNSSHSSTAVQWQEKEKSSKSHLQKINHSLSNMKINLRKRHTFPTLEEGSGVSTSDKDDYALNDNDSAIHHHHHQSENQLPPLPPIPQQHQQQQHQHQHQQNLPASALNTTVAAMAATSTTTSLSQQQRHSSDTASSHHRIHDDGSSTREQGSILQVGKHNQVKNIMRRVIKIGNTSSGSSIKKNYSNKVY